MDTNLPLSLYECIFSASVCYIFILIYLGIFYFPSDFNLDILVTEEYLHFMRCHFFFFYWFLTLFDYGSGLCFNLFENIEVCVTTWPMVCLGNDHM